MNVFLHLWLHKGRTIQYIEKNCENVGKLWKGKVSGKLHGELLLG